MQHAREVFASHNTTAIKIQNNVISKTSPGIKIKYILKEDTAIDINGYLIGNAEELKDLVGIKIIQITGNGIEFYLIAGSSIITFLTFRGLYIILFEHNRAGNNKN